MEPEQQSIDNVFPEPVIIEGQDPEELAALKNLEERRAQKRRKRIVKIAIVCGVVVVAIAAWAIFNAVNSAAQQKEVKPVTALAVREDLVDSVQATGALKPSSQVAVTPEVSGVIQEVMVSEGQQVQAGDVLFTLKNTELEKALGDAGSALERARRSLAEAQSGASNAWDTYYEAIDAYNSAVDEANSVISNASAIASQAYADVYDVAIAAIPSTATEQEREKLIEEARIAAQAAYDTAYDAAVSADPGSFDHSGYLSVIDAAQSATISDEEALEDAQRAYDYAVEQADKRTVRAPVAGTVLDLKAVPGAAVGGATGGTSTAASGSLMEIADLSSLGVDVEVNEVDIANVKPGQRVKVTFTAIPGLELDGSVVSVASVATNASGEAGAAVGGVVTFKVSTVIDQPDERLKPGMSASVTIMTQYIPDALVVPAAAVIEDGAKAYVLVVADENASNPDMREIVVGDRTSTLVAVERGLSEGEMVLVDSLGAGSSASSASAIAG